MAIRKSEAARAVVIGGRQIIPMRRRGIRVRIGLQKAVVDAVGMFVAHYEKSRGIGNTSRFEKLAVGRVVIVSTRVRHVRPIDTEKPVHRVGTRASSNAGSYLLRADKMVGGASVRGDA